MITIDEVAELVVRMNDSSRQLVAQNTELEAENKALKEQLAKAVPANG